VGSLAMRDGQKVGSLVSNDRDSCLAECKKIEVKFLPLFRILMSLNKMKKLLTTILLTILVAMTAFSQEITADKVPARVKQSFTKQYPTALMVKYEQNNADYIISFLQQGKQFIITYNNAGQVVASDKEIDPAKLPVAVSASALKNFPGYQIMTAIKREAVSMGVCYEMDLKKEGAGYSVRFSDKGEILQKEAKTVQLKIQTKQKR